MTASATLSGPDAGYEYFSLPSEQYRSSLLSLLAAQAGPVWSIGQQEPYAAMVMDGAGLEHWVRMSGVWAEVERSVWELTCLLRHLGVESVEELPRRAARAGQLSGGRDQGALIADATESWVDLLLCELVIGKLATAMVLACRHSTYAPLTRSSRLLVFSKRGIFASGYLGVQEAASRNQVPRAMLRARAARWLDVGAALAEQLDDDQKTQAWVELGIAAAVDGGAALSEAGATINELLKVDR
jgi:hypothetical protein